MQEEILSSDELIQQERAKLQDLQEQMKEKLRQAELDISVQRATLAREQSALEEKLHQLQHQLQGSEEESQVTPRRRWLSALGIKEDDAENK